MKLIQARHYHKGRIAPIRLVVLQTHCQADLKLR